MGLHVKAVQYQPFATVTGTEVLTACVIGIALFALASAGWLLFERGRERAADRQMRAAWDSYLAEVPSTLPDYDGATYDWPETGLSRYLAAAEGAVAEPVPEARTEPFTRIRTTAPLSQLRETVPFSRPRKPAPPSRVSGPLPAQDMKPGYDPAADAEVYLAWMREDLAAFRVQAGMTR